MKNVFGTERLVALLKCLMAAYLITGVMLVMVAGFLYKFSIGENVVDISIIVIYCISSLLAGLFFSKGAPSRRFIWGMLAGAAYFLVICAVSGGAGPGFLPVRKPFITARLVLVGRGGFGGVGGVVRVFR